MLVSLPVRPAVSSGPAPPFPLPLWLFGFRVAVVVVVVTFADGRWRRRRQRSGAIFRAGRATVVASVGGRCRRSASTASRLDALLPLALDFAILFPTNNINKLTFFLLQNLLLNVITLQLQLMHRISPHGWMRGCHSSPFSKTSPLNLHPPEERMSTSPLACACSSSSAGSLLLFAGVVVVAGCAAGHCLQQAIGSGR